MKPEELQTAVETATEQFRQFALRESLVVSGDGRVNEKAAAKLLGYSAGHLKNMRQEGKGPTFYSTGVAGGRYSYRLCDLAAWVELTRTRW
ncbi:MAG: hypothetical protein EON54_27835 [Alcaligenaceae bacterium]|nr:MAG: hypothetical protein EON54_27835 [Alcaligenaceae bacterium]